MKEVNVMILAAGEGTRLRPFTLTLPKPAMPFLNVPLASYSLAFLGDLKINKLVVNTFHLPNQVHELFNKIPHRANELHFSDEVGQLLGNGGGLGKAKKHFLADSDFVMMNSDEVILPKDPNILRKAIEKHKETKALATLLVMDHPEVGEKFGGVWVDSHERVLGFGKTPTKNSVKGWHYIGVLILSDRIFDYIPNEGASNILYDVIMAGILKDELVQILSFECTWFETGNPKDFLEATSTCLKFLTDKTESTEKTYLQSIFKKYASSELITEVKSNCTVHCPSGQETKEDLFSQSEGFVCLSKGAVLGANCILKNTIIGEDVRVPEGTRAENTFLL